MELVANGSKRLISKTLQKYQILNYEYFNPFYLNTLYEHLGLV